MHEEGVHQEEAPERYIHGPKSFSLDQAKERNGSPVGLPYTYVLDLEGIWQDFVIISVNHNGSKNMSYTSGLNCLKTYSERKEAL